jgi:hypothetical protein
MFDQQIFLGPFAIRLALPSVSRNLLVRYLSQGQTEQALSTQVYPLGGFDEARRRPTQRRDPCGLL